MSRPTHPPTARAERFYRMLLVAYPPDFRREYGDDMVQVFRDLAIHSSDGRGLWWRTARDLVTSAVRERAATFSGDKRPSFPVLLLLAAAVVVVFVAGPGPLLPVILVPPMILVGLPAFGLSRFHRAWLIRRTSGGAIARQITIGLASFVPAVAVLVIFGGDAGYWIFVSVALALIAASAIGIVWGVSTLVRSWRSSDRRRRRLLSAAVLVPSLAVLGFIIGASYNSYRQSLGPPGDHSVENASADTRALWTAAGDGQVEQVEALISTTCADPWVKFPVGDGRHNAKGLAEARELEVSGEAERPFSEISDLLGEYMDDWYERCGKRDS